MRSSSRSRRRWLAASLLAALLPAGPVAADDPQPISFEVTVVHVSNREGGVQATARARRVDRIIGPQIKYDSLRVLDFMRRQVPLNQIGSVTLPSGKRFRFRPMDLSDEGVLVAVVGGLLVYLALRFRRIEATYRDTDLDRRGNRP